MVCCLVWQNRSGCGMFLPLRVSAGLVTELFVMLLTNSGFSLKTVTRRNYYRYQATTKKEKSIISKAAIVRVTLASESDGDFTFIIPVSGEDYLAFKGAGQTVLKHLEAKVNSDMDCYSNISVAAHDKFMSFEEAVRAASAIELFGGPSVTNVVLGKSDLGNAEYTIYTSREALSEIVEAAKKALTEETSEKVYKKFDELMIG